MLSHSLATLRKILKLEDCDAFSQSYQAPPSSAADVGGGEGGGGWGKRGAGAGAGLARGAGGGSAAASASEKMSGNVGLAISPLQLLIEWRAHESPILSGTRQ